MPIVKGLQSPVIVMGMSRSGTTLVAEMVHKGGTPMFSGDLDPQYDKGIRYERPICQEINRQILGKEGTSGGLRTIAELWTLPLQPISSEWLEKLSHEVGNDSWGFKDPRTTLTYSKWNEVFPSGARLYVYRSHQEVMRHRLHINKPLHKRLKRMRRAVEAWAQYNEQIIANLHTDLQAKRPAALVRYEELMAHDDLVERLSEAVGLKLFDARNPAMRRNKVTSRKDVLLCSLASLGYRNRLNLLYQQLGALRIQPGHVHSPNDTKT